MKRDNYEVDLGNGVIATADCQVAVIQNWLGCHQVRSLLIDFVSDEKNANTDPILKLQAYSTIYFLESLIATFDEVAKKIGVTDFPSPGQFHDMLHLSFPELQCDKSGRIHKN
jgi:hypothetical protein